MEWGGSRQEIEGAIRTAVGRRESGKENNCLNFYHLGLYLQFNFQTKIFISQAMKTLLSVNFGSSACLECHRERPQVVCSSPEGTPNGLNGVGD